MSFNVSGLTNYVATNREVLIKDAVLGSDEKNFTLPIVRHQLGVKTSERLNYMEVNPILQDGSSCGFSAQGSTVLSDRVIETSIMKYNDSWCWKDVLGKFAEYQVNINANEDSLPFESQITDQIVKGINKEVERLIWVGNKSNSDLIDGWLTLSLGADSASTITGQTAVGASAYEAIEQTYMAIPERWIDEAIIFVSPALFREYCNDLVAKNLFNYSGENGQLNEMFFPASNVKIRKAKGLEGSNYIYASVPDNMVFACDMLDAKEDFKMWYNDEDELVKVKVLFNGGCSTLYPDSVVVVERK